MRTLLGVIATVACFAVPLAGCRSDSDRARNAVKDFLSGLADGDGREVCDQLTAKARRQMLEQSGKESCDSAAKTLSSSMPAGDRAKLRAATVTVQTKEQGYDAVARIEGGDEVPLTKVDGDFKIVAFDFRQ